jgi:hypothetical protein
MDQAKPYEIAGYPVICAHCTHDVFFARRVLLQGRPLMLLDPNWTQAVNYICVRCGHLMWFYDLPKDAESRIGDDGLTEELLEGEESPPVTEDAGEVFSATEPTECLSCGEMIPTEKSECPSCHWSYRDALPK